VTAADDDRLWLNAYIDGELDPAHALQFEQRLAADPALAAAHARMTALRGAIRDRVPRERASPILRRRVAALARPRPAPGWRALAASVAAAFVAGSALTYFALGTGGSAPVAQDVVASHMRALMASQPIEVAATTMAGARKSIAGSPVAITNGTAPTTAEAGTAGETRRAFRLSRAFRVSA